MNQYFPTGNQAEDFPEDPSCSWIRHLRKAPEHANVVWNNAQKVPTSAPRTCHTFYAPSHAIRRRPSWRNASDAYLPRPPSNPTRRDTRPASPASGRPSLDRRLPWIDPLSFENVALPREGPTKTENGTPARGEGRGPAGTSQRTDLFLRSCLHQSYRLLVAEALTIIPPHKNFHRLRAPPDTVGGAYPLTRRLAITDRDNAHATEQRSATSSTSTRAHKATPRGVT